MNENLRDLAILKLKYDLYKQLYEEKADELKIRLETVPGKTIYDKENGLTITITDQPRRQFNVQGVKDTLGKIATLCTEEKISAKDFDALIKKESITLTKEQQYKCYTTDHVPSLTWDGLKSFAQSLKDKQHASNINK